MSRTPTLRSNHRTPRLGTHLVRHHRRPMSCPVLAIALIFWCALALIAVAFVLFKR
jgi:hypothetical protein